ncbi:NXPE family member 3-like [Aplochiton taeniatus]
MGTPRTPTPYNKSHCFRYSGQKASPEEAEEERVLLDSIAWPRPPAQLANTPLEQTSDPTKSTFTILPAGGDGERHVGDQLKAVIHMYNFQGRHRPHGGDFLVARLHSPTLLAGVAGQVLDHGNGSYSAVFPLLWEGSAQVEVTLVHPYEAIPVLQWVTDEHPDREFFHSLFRSGTVSETTVCNRCLPPNQQPLCNYTDVLTGEPWFCFKPKVLGCDTRDHHVWGGELKDLITKEEEMLFRGGVNLKVFINAFGTNSIDVLPERKGQPDLNGSSNLKLGPPKVMPSGYYFQGEWRTLGGVTVRQFKDSSSITQCLQGKVVHMFGDSTVRQWYGYLKDTAGIKEFDLHSPSKTGPLLAVDTANNIMLKFRFHGQPIRHAQVTSASELRYISSELDHLRGGSDTVVIIGVWAHFSITPMELYIRRLRQIRRALVLLLDRAPETVVVIRTGNLGRLDLQQSLRNSDWYAWQMNKLLRAMFKGMDVLLVNSWDMVLASHLPHDLHPPPPIISDMVNYVVEEAIVVIKEIFCKYPNNYGFI